MIISNDTKEVINFIDEVTGGNLRKKNDLSVILEVGATYGLDILITDFIFDGAYFWRLSQSLQRAQTGEVNYDKLVSEHKITALKLNEMIGQLTDVIEDEQVIERFKAIYLSNSDGALRNLIDLSHDLSALKGIQNEIKNRNK